MANNSSVDGHQPLDKNNKPVQAMAIASVQVVDGTSSSAQSTAFSRITVVRISSLSDVYLEFGTNPTAVAATSSLFPGGNVEYFKVNSGDKIAVISGEITISTME